MVTRPLNSVTKKIIHIFGTGRPTNFGHDTWMEYNDLHHRHAQWPQRSRLPGHIMLLPKMERKHLQTSKLVYGWVHWCVISKLKPLGGCSSKPLAGGHIVATALQATNFVKVWQAAIRKIWEHFDSCYWHPCRWTSWSCCVRLGSRSWPVLTALYRKVLTSCLAMANCTEAVRCAMLQLHGLAEPV